MGKEVINTTDGWRAHSVQAPRIKTLLLRKWGQALTELVISVPRLR